MRRNDLKIQADLLEIARPGSRKTRLVYQGNLNFKVITPYLKKMIDLGLMKVVEHEKKLDEMIARLEAITPTLEKEMNK